MKLAQRLPSPGFILLYKKSVVVIISIVAVLSYIHGFQKETINTGYGQITDDNGVNLIMDTNKLFQNNAFLKKDSIQNSIASTQFPHVSKHRIANTIVTKNVKNLTLEDLPPLDPGMINVTADGEGVRVTGFGGKRKALSISINLDKIPVGYTSNDVHIFLYSPEQGHWIQLIRDSLDMHNGTVYSTTSKDGDYINAIIQVPDMPETQGYVPTTMNDIKVGDPASMIQIIAPPKANAQGTANLTYHIITPKGRQGVEPDLNIVYNSDAANGFLGEGWSLAGLSSITVDTRRGAKYDSTIETDTYLLDGQMLAYRFEDGKSPVFFPDISRASVTQSGRTHFSPRRENPFDSILRIGNKPADYTWIVYKKNGWKYFYGRDENTLKEDVILRKEKIDKDGNRGIAEWKLHKIIDKYDNVISFKYEKETSNGIAFFPVQIDYTLHQSPIKLSTYRVKFVYKISPDIRSDNSIYNARLGITTNQTQVRLDSIVVLGIKSQAGLPKLIRKYGFEYQEGVFRKLLLKKISHYGDNGELFNAHEFSYYNEKPGQPFFSDFKSVTVPNSGFSAGVKDPLGIITNEPTGIGGSKSGSNSVSMYVGVGPGYDVWSVNNSGGIQYNNSSSNSTGMTTLIDIDGDARPDKVFATGNKIGFYRNLSLNEEIKFDNNVTYLSGAPADFMEESSRTTGWGAKASFFAFSGSYDKSNTESVGKTYFSDVNGDGFVDIVSNGSVYFNTGKISGGNLIFSPKSSETPLPINGTGSISSVFVYDSSANKELIKNNPLQEAIRFWEAPYEGTILLNAPARLLEFEEKDDKSDGVWISVEAQHFDTSFQIKPDDFSTHEIKAKIKVNKGERIFFRLKSGLEDDANGTADKVDWTPKIKYAEGIPLKIDTTLSSNLLDRIKYNGSEDFLLSNPSAFTLPDSVFDLKLLGSFKKEKTMDSVVVQMIEFSLDRSKPIRDREGNIVTSQSGDIAYDYSFSRVIDSAVFRGDDNVNRISLNLPTGINPKDKKYQFLVKSKVNINLHNITWTPSISFKKTIQLRRYTNDTDWITVPKTIIDTIHIIPTYIFNDSLRSLPVAYDSILSGTDIDVVFYPKILQSKAIDSSFWFAVKSPTKVLGKKLLTFKNGMLSDTLPLRVRIPKGELFITTFESQSTRVGKTKTEAYQDVCNSIVSTGYYFQTDFSSAYFGRRQNAGAHISDYLVPIVKKGKYFIIPKLSVDKDSTKGQVIMQVWKNGSRVDLGNQDSTIGVANGKFQYPLNFLALDFANGDNVSVLFLYENDTLTNNPSLRKSFSITQNYDSEFWINRTNQTFGPMYRGWGQFVYNGMAGRSKARIDQSILNIPTGQTVSDPDITNFRRTVEISVNSQQPIATRDPLFDRFSAANIVFLPMIPYANAETRSWLGTEDSIYVAPKNVSTSRLGIDNVKALNPFKVETINTTVGDNSYGRGITRVTNSESDSYNVGVDFLSGSKSSTKTTQISEFIDMNGDGFPDIINGGNIQFTNTVGKLTTVKLNSFLHKSNSDSKGLAVSGAKGIKVNNAVPQSPGKAQNAAQVNGNNANNVDESAGAFIGASGGYNINEDKTSFTWLDINGDGLPDKVQNGSYSLNMGNGEFDASRSFTGLEIYNGIGKTLSPGVTAGFSFDKRSFSGGAGLSFSNSKGEIFLQDMNGDGLQDKVTVEGDGTLSVFINSGKEFFKIDNYSKDISKGRNGLGGLGDAASLPVAFLASSIIPGWKEMERTKFNSSNAVSFGGSATFGFAIPIISIKFVFNPGFNHSNSLGRTVRQIIDINADGYPDILYSNKQGAIEVMLSQLGKTNKLAEVKNPLGGSFTLDYSHVDVTTESRGGKWVMSSLTINDGVKADRTDSSKNFDSKTLFKYSGGKYDRFEKEYLGFADVVSTDVNFDDTPNRETIVKYSTNYYVAGEVLEEIVRDAKDTTKKYTILKNEYHNYEIHPQVAAVGAFKRQVGIIFSPLKSTSIGTYEGGSTVLWKNISTYSYSKQYGYVTNFSYKEHNDASIEYETTIKYLDDPSYYIIGLPVDVLTKNKAGEVLRHIGAEYYTWNPETLGQYEIGEKRALKKVFKYLDNKRKTVTEFQYVNDNFGNINKMILPSGLIYEYEYDNDGTSTTNTYIKKVKNSTFNFESSTEYNYEYGIPIMTKDINDKQVYYQLDHFGRIIEIIGPKECNNPGTQGCETKAKYTIKIKYGIEGGNKSPTIITPVTATVNHYDQEYKEGISTINFVDGFARSVQVKKTAALSKPDGSPNDAVKWIVSGRVNYDALGRAIQAFYPGTDITDDGLKFISEPVSKYVTRSEYDVLDRKTRTIMPDGQTFDSTVYTKDNKFTIATIFSPNDPKTSGGLQKRQVYTNGSDLKGKEVVFDNADTAIVTNFIYDAVHQLKTVVDPRNTITTYTYDPSGNKTKVAHPDGGITGFTYDDRGRLQYKITAVGDSVEYKYNANRLERILYKRHPENNVLYVYSNSRSVTLPGESSARDINACNRLIYQEDASGSQAFEYGALGEITKTTRTIISPFSSKINTFKTEFEYDSWNRLRSILYPDQELVVYNYNKGGLLLSVKGNRKNMAREINRDYSYVKEITYDEFEQRRTIEYGNGTKTKYSYEPSRRRLENLNISGLQAGTIFTNNFNEIFRYDNQNNIISNTINTNNGAATSLSSKETFFYDRLNRLDSAYNSWKSETQTATYNLAMDYDGVFNITGKRLVLDSKKGGQRANIDYDHQYFYDDLATHQLTRLEEQIQRNHDPNYQENNKELYTYDNNGNNTVRSTGDKSGTANVFRRQIYWDEENRINAVSMNGYVSHYVYDASGERTIKLSTENEGIYINGKFAGDTSAPVTFSLYANPYFSMRNGNGIYTKHIYIGTQRIVSQVENEKVFRLPDNTFPDKIPVAKCPFTPCNFSQEIDDKRKQLNGRINADFAKFGFKYEYIKDNAFENPMPFKYKPAINPLGDAKIIPEPLPSTTRPQLLNYFYHNNQVGSTTFITSDSAKVVQYVAYLPFGETFIELRQNYSSQFLFNSKEQDQETGLYYYGARYFDPHTYQWLGVDPMADKYPGLSPYNFNLGNPLTFVDFNGNAPGNPSTVPSYLIGTSEYYNFRNDDYNQYQCWNPWDRKPVDYYRDYGFKYAERFTNELRPNLSDQGKIWLDKTKELLQIKLEQRLSQNPNLENNPEELKRTAFETHVDAYLEAGLKDLPVGDKLKIIMTPDISDIFSKNGIEQIKNFLPKYFNWENKSKQEPTSKDQIILP